MGGAAGLLERSRQGEAKLMFPTRLNLEVLARSRSAADTVAAARAQKVVTVEPRVEERADDRAHNTSRGRLWPDGRAHKNVMG